jgi:hypothetical protein
MILRKLKIRIMKYDINCVWKEEAGIMPRITTWIEEKGKGDVGVLLVVKGGSTRKDLGVIGF